MRLGYFAILNMICVMAVSCSPDTSDDIIVFPIAEDLGKDVIKSNDTPSFILVHVTDVSSIALSVPRIVYVNDSLYGIHADKSLYFVDRKSGDVFSDLTHIGRGPSEYLYPDHVSVNDDIVSISDDKTVGKLLSYSIDGDYIGSESIPAQSVLHLSDSGSRILVYSNQVAKDVEIYEDGVLQGSYVLSKGPENTGNIYGTGISDYGGHVYVKPFFSDAMYRIVGHEVEPYVLFDKGRKRMPDKYYATVSSYSERRGKYITREYLRVCGDYAFVSFDYQHMLYKEIWRISDQKRLYRVVEGKTPEPQGIPVEINGKTIAFWPQYCQGHDMFSVIEDGDSSYVVQLMIHD